MMYATKSALQLQGGFRAFGLGLCAALLTFLASCAVPPPAGGSAQTVVQVATQPAAPIAERRPFMVLSPHGARQDDYYWLRDDTRSASDVLAYLNAENAYADTVLKPVQGLRERIYENLVARMPGSDRSAPVFDHGYWYYTRFPEGQEYPVYARRKASMESEEQVLLDGNAEGANHGYYRVGGWAVSPDNRLMAYAQDTLGRRQYEIRARRIDSAELLADRIANAEAEFVWADSRTLLYIEKDPVTLLSTRVRKHVLGSDPAMDPVIYEEADHSFYMTLSRSKSGKYLFIVLTSTLASETRYALTSDATLSFRPVLPREPDHLYSVDHLTKDFVIRSNWQAPNFRIVSVPPRQSANKAAWKERVAHRPDASLEDFALFPDYLAVQERSGGLSRLRVQLWNGKGSTLIDAEEPSFAASLGPNPDPRVPTLRYQYTSLATPASAFDYDPRSGEKRLVKQDLVLGGFDHADYVTEYLHASARDGTPVPISLMYRKGLPRDGRAALYQYAYGSYGNSTDPVFRPAWIELADRGFVVAIAHVRGGQELGRSWYEDGKLLRKWNTFTDFIDVTQYLVDQRYVAPDKVFAMGGSAGGLLMGAVANLAPEKYRGIVAHVPFVDVVTTMLDEAIPLTTNEFDEWGNPKQKPYYDYMLSYSPYDNVAARAYPAMYVTTGLWDSQVQYYEPAKWVARLRATKTDHHPLLLRTNMEAGHGGKSGRYARHRETAEEYAFILQTLGTRP